MCTRFVVNLIEKHPRLRSGEARCGIIVENNNGPWPVDSFIRDIRLAFTHEAPEVTVFCAYRTELKRNKETREMEQHILFGTVTTNASKVLGVQYTRVMLCCGSIRFHSDFFSDGIGTGDETAALEAHTKFFEQLARFGPNKINMQNGRAGSISYSGMKDDGIKADDLCMAWIVFLVSSLEMFDQSRYLDARVVYDADKPSLVMDIHNRMTQYAGNISLDG